MSISRHFTGSLILTAAFVALTFATAKSAEVQPAATGPVVGTNLYRAILFGGKTQPSGEAEEIAVASTPVKRTQFVTPQKGDEPVVQTAFAMATDQPAGSSAVNPDDALMAVAVPRLMSPLDLLPGTSPRPLMPSEPSPNEEAAPVPVVIEDIGLKIESPANASPVSAVPMTGAIETASPKDAQVDEPALYPSMALNMGKVIELELARAARPNSQTAGKQPANTADDSMIQSPLDVPGYGTRTVSAIRDTGAQDRIEPTAQEQPANQPLKLASVALPLAALANLAKESPEVSKPLPASASPSDRHPNAADAGDEASVIEDAAEPELHMPMETRPELLENPRIDLAFSEPVEVSLPGSPERPMSALTASPVLGAELLEDTITPDDVRPTAMLERIRPRSQTSAQRNALANSCMTSCPTSHPKSCPLPTSMPLPSETPDVVAKPMPKPHAEFSPDDILSYKPASAQPKRGVLGSGESSDMLPQTRAILEHYERTTGGNRSSADRVIALMSGSDNEPRGVRPTDFTMPDPVIQDPARVDELGPQPFSEVDAQRLPTPPRMFASSDIELFESVGPVHEDPTYATPVETSPDSMLCRHAGDYRFSDGQLQLFAGIDGFKGMLDLDGANGNFGTRFGVNGALPVLKQWNIAVQGGTSAVLSDFHGTSFTGSQSRTQSFTTLGMFQNIEYQHLPVRLRYGFGYDWYFDQYYNWLKFSQWRIQTELQFGSQAAIGFWYAIPGDGDNAQIGVPGSVQTERFKSVAQGVVYWRQSWEKGAVTSLRFGLAEEPGEVVFGADAAVPLTDRLAIVGDFNYILPSAVGERGRDEEMWNLSFGLEWTFGSGGTRRGNHLMAPFRPLLPLAGNSTFAMRRY